MAGHVDVLDGAIWDGAPVVECTLMPGGRVAVARLGASTVLADADDLVAAAVLDRTPHQVMLADMQS